MSEKSWYHLYAEKHGVQVNKELEEVIHEGLERKKQMLGARYCPCKLVNSIENVCPCQEFRNQGHCHCGLFVKTNQEDKSLLGGSVMEHKKVLFLCTHNSARSQIAEGLLRAMYGDRYESFSAGTEVTRVNPYVIKSMAEVGIDLSSHRSKLLQEYINDEFDYVVTVCDNAKEACPYFPNAKARIHHSFPDPSQFRGTEIEILEGVAKVRNQIKSWIEETFGKKP